MSVFATPNSPTIPSSPATDFRRCERNTSRTRTMVMRATGKATRSVVERRIRNCGIGPSTSISPPAIIAMMPPTARMPWLVIVASRTNRKIARRIKAAPAQFTGSILKAKSARIRLMAPITPGRMSPGWVISTYKPNIPRRPRISARFGSKTRDRILCRDVISKF